MLSCCRKCADVRESALAWQHPDRKPNMTDAEYMQFLDLEARRYLKHIGWDATEIWGPPVAYAADMDLVTGPAATQKGAGSSPSARVRSQHMSQMSMNSDSDGGRDSAFTTSNIHSAPTKLAAGKVRGANSVAEGAVPPPAIAADAAPRRETGPAVSLNSTEEEEEEKQWERQGSPRWLIRALEGESSDTWVDETGRKRRREWADPFERAEDLGFAEMQA